MQIIEVKGVEEMTERCKARERADKLPLKSGQMIQFNLCGKEMSEKDMILNR